MLALGLGSEEIPVVRVMSDASQFAASSHAVNPRGSLTRDLPLDLGARSESVMRRTSWIILTVICLWSALVSAGLFALWSYGAAPGEAGTPPSPWPSESHIAREGRYTLVFFAHPLCPCTRSSLTELARLVSVCDAQVDAHVVFILPEDGDSSWSESDLIATAHSIPGVTVHVDRDRRETKLFHARTSGSCCLYDADGRLIFQGGLTVARGHEGDNDGARTILKMLKDIEAPVCKTPVFGCPLFETGNSCPQPKSSTH